AIATVLAYPDARLSFNVSGTSATDPRWCRQLTDMLAAHRDVTPRITVEITETVVLADLEETGRFTKTLRDLGCAVAIDDFGSGYSSFRNLRALSVDLLKLDGSFCDGISGNRDNQYFVASFVDLARKFGIKTVAEWVQCEEDAGFLRLAGVDYLQGNFFGAASIELPWSASAQAPGSSPATSDAPMTGGPPDELFSILPDEAEPAGIALVEPPGKTGGGDQPELSPLAQ